MPHELIAGLILRAFFVLAVGLLIVWLTLALPDLPDEDVVTKENAEPR